MEELWKPVEDLPFGYEISSFGHMRIDYGDHYEPLEVHNVKLGTAIYINGIVYKIHRLVADAFIPNPDGKTMVKHIDGNLHNNRVDNLMWVSRSEESKKYFSSGKIKGTRCYCRETDKLYATISTASACLGIPVCAIEYGMQHEVPMFGYTFESVDENTPYDSEMIFLPKTDIIRMGIESKSVDILRNL